MDALLRLLDLVRRELGADDTRAEIGGRDPEGDRVVFARLPSGHRIVVVFDAPPADLELARNKLTALLDSFAGVIEPPRIEAPLERAPGAYRNLREELDALVARAQALRAVVIDDRSPVVWGISEGAADLDVTVALQIADAATLAQESGLAMTELLDAAKRDELVGALDRDRRAKLRRALSSLRHDVPSLESLADRDATILVARAIAGARRTATATHAHRDVEHGPSLGWLSRSFASIYRLVLVWSGPFSELHADAAMIHALPVIERLVLSLPPRDPVGQGARVLKMGRRLRPV